MNELALTLIALSAPGFIFQKCFDLVARVRRRRSRDLFGAIGALFMLSAVLAAASLFVVEFAGEPGAKPVIETYVIRPLLPASLRGAYDDDEIISSLVAVTLTLAALAGISGILAGKFHAWGAVGGFGGRTVIEDLVKGVRPPAVYATVLSTTQTGGVQLVYRGALAAIQVSPEGKIEYVALANPEKSALAFNARARQARTTKPFERVNSNPGGAVLRDRLLIESDDIANLYFEVSSGIARPDLLDSFAYLLCRLVGAKV